MHTTTSHQATSQITQRDNGTSRHRLIDNDHDDDDGTSNNIDSRSSGRRATKPSRVDVLASAGQGSQGDTQLVGGGTEAIDESEDEERDALIAGFRDHLDRNEPDNVLNQRHHRTNSHHSKVEPTESDRSVRQKCDIDKPVDRDPTQAANIGVKCKNNTSASNMKYDHRKEAVVTDGGKNTAKHAMNYKKTYLFVYNLAMFVMFLMVNMILCIKGFAGKMDDDSVQGAAFIIKLLTYTQLLESIHPILGLVPGGPWMPFLQVIGRLFVNHFLTEPEIRMSSAPYAHYLFIVWSSIEVFRYSFYALRVFNVEIYPITWCRYTLFMPLYPMGGFCEAMIVLATARHYEKTGAFTLSLPNGANFAFSLPIFLRVYPYVLLTPSIYHLMRYMWSQRCKQLKEKSE